MRIQRLLIVTVLTIALLPVGLADAASSVGTHGDAGATAKKKHKKAKAKAKRRKCRKGYVLRTVKVKRKGRTVRVKRCRKKPAPKKKAAAPIPAPPTTPAPGPGVPGPLFDPPGAKLEGEAARPFIERYLLDSRFTDCPAGWPSCAVEERYSHFASGAFFYCRLTPTSGSDIAFGSTYEVQNAIVEADGSWSFDEIVPSGESSSFYTWYVGIDGTVTGVYKFPGQPPEQVGPLRYAAGARDCGT